MGKKSHRQLKKERPWLYTTGLTPTPSPIRRSLERRAAAQAQPPMAPTQPSTAAINLDSHESNSVISIDSTETRNIATRSVIEPETLALELALAAPSYATGQAQSCGAILRDRAGNISFPLSNLTDISQDGFYARDDEYEHFYVRDSNRQKMIVV